MRDVASIVGLWQQVVSRIVPLMLLSEKFTQGLLYKVHDDVSLQRSLLQLASGSYGDPPDSVEDIHGMVPYIVKHLPVLKMLEADHRHESRAVAEEHPQAMMTRNEMVKLSSGVYSGEITLDANRYLCGWVVGRS